MHWPRDRLSYRTFYHNSGGQVMYCICTGPETGHHTGFPTTFQEVRSCTVYALAQRQTIIQDFLPHFRRSGHTVNVLAQRQAIIQDLLPHFRRSGHVLYMYIVLALRQAIIHDFLYHTSGGKVIMYYNVYALGWSVEFFFDRTEQGK